MSRQNVELAVEVLDALRHRDVERLNGLADPDIEWWSLFAELGEGGVYRGHEGTQQYMSALSEWEDTWNEIDQTLAVGDVVVLVGRVSYRGHRSGVEAQTTMGWMLKFRQGKLVRYRAFRAPEQALEALGLEA